jgi:hypothetical protein
MGDCTAGADTFKVEPSAAAPTPVLGLGPVGEMGDSDEPLHPTAKVTSAAIEQYIIVLFIVTSSPESRGKRNKSPAR